MQSAGFPILGTGGRPARSGGQRPSPPAPFGKLRASSLPILGEGRALLSASICPSVVASLPDSLPFGYASCYHNARMKAVVLTGPKSFEVADRPVPKIGPDDLLLKVHACDWAVGVLRGLPWWVMRLRRCPQSG